MPIITSLPHKLSKSRNSPKLNQNFTGDLLHRAHCYIVIVLLSVEPHVTEKGGTTDSQLRL